MQVIKTLAALEAVTDLSLRPHLERYADLMELAVVFIVEPTDILATLEDARGWSFEDWEFIHHHASGWFEAVFVLSQDGAGHVVFVPDCPEAGSALMQLCHTNSEPSQFP